MLPLLAEESPVQQLPEETQNKIVELYLASLSAKRIAAQLGVSKAAVLSSLRRKGVPVRAATCPHPVPIPVEKQDAIVADYLRGVNAVAVGRTHGVHQASVLNILARRNIQTRSLEQTTRNPNHRHDFFTSIDTDAKAWVLGLIASDGNVAARANSITIGLKAEDADALEKLRDLACPTSRVARRMCRDSRTKRLVEYAILCWNSRQATSDLARHGITPAKSKTLRPWAGPTELMPAYWRGMLDGDGSWVRYFRSGRMTATCQLSLTGAQAVVEGFRDFVQEATGNTPSVCPCRTAWVCMVGSMPTVAKLVPILYDGAAAWMDRKRLKAELIAADINSRSRLAL